MQRRAQFVGTRRLDMVFEVRRSDPRVSIKTRPPRIKKSFTFPVYEGL